MINRFILCKYWLKVCGSESSIRWPMPQASKPKRKLGRKVSTYVRLGNDQLTVGMLQAFDVGRNYNIS